MGETTGISWTDHTFNPWWGCWKIAPECLNCYADSTAARYAPGHWGRTAPRKFFGDAHWNEPRKWNRKAERDGVRRRVFCGSMCDWAEIHPEPSVRALMGEARDRLFSLIKETPHLNWLLLTKRIDDAAGLLPWMPIVGSTGGTPGNPWPNIWIGTTAGTRKALGENVPILRSIPAAVRFISCEPILEDISAAEWDQALRPRLDYSDGMIVADPQLDWLIVGDESGNGARPADPAWVRAARDSAARNGVAFHFKQWCGVDAPGIEGRSAPRKKIHLPILDGVQHAAFPENAR